MGRRNAIYKIKCNGASMESSFKNESSGHNDGS